MADKTLLVSDAIRTVEHSPHMLSGASLQVSLFEEFEDKNHDDLEENIDENDITVIVSGISPSTTEDAVINYFENSRRSGGGEVSNIDSTDEGAAIITFLEVKGTSSITSSFLSHVEVHTSFYVMSCRHTGSIERTI